MGMRRDEECCDADRAEYGHCGCLVRWKTATLKVTMSQSIQIFMHDEFTILGVERLI